MLSSFFSKIRLILGDQTLLKRLLFIFAAFVAFRFLATIPIPGINAIALEQFFTNNQFFGFLNIFSGGGLSNLSIVMLGVGPYITASIVMQLVTVMWPRVKEMYQEEGEAGRARFSQYSRLLTFPFALLQGSSLLLLLRSQGILNALTWFDLAVGLCVIVAGSMLLMWIGELITEYGIGNGVSLIIFAGIVAGLPSALAQIFFTFDVAQIPTYLAFLVAGLLVTLGVVVVSEAERPVPVTYAKRVRGMQTYGGLSTYIPLRLNQSGVIPIIFALSILLFPQMIFSYLATANIALLSDFATSAVAVLNNQIVYAVLYFSFVFGFTFFYTAVTFDPDTIAKNLQRSGAFIPGIRPGETTSMYLGQVITRITLVGATFLAAIAVLPLMVQGLTGITQLALGGTALLIAVSVVLDLVRKIDAQVSMREY
jgi:preprotein translocase subunit SecY